MSGLSNSTPSYKPLWRSGTRYRSLHSVVHEQVLAANHARQLCPDVPARRPGAFQLLTVTQQRWDDLEVSNQALSIGFKT